uniref:Uncharacterized protein n=1 Tax=Oryza glumipatula TaxID=40148 RepID=A0A0E0AAD4_9ORYZ
MNKMNGRRILTKNGRNILDFRSSLKAWKAHRGCKTAIVGARPKRIAHMVRSQSPICHTAIACHLRSASCPCPRLLPRGNQTFTFSDGAETGPLPCPFGSFLVLPWI